MKTKIELDLRAPGRFVSWAYLSDYDHSPDIGSVMQVNRHRFRVLEVEVSTVTPLSSQKKILIKGELL